MWKKVLKVEKGRRRFKSWRIKSCYEMIEWSAKLVGFFFFLFCFVVSRRKFLGNVAEIREMEIIRFFEI